MTREGKAQGQMIPVSQLVAGEVPHGVDRKKSFGNLISSLLIFLSSD